MCLFVCLQILDVCLLVFFFCWRVRPDVKILVEQPFTSWAFKTPEMIRVQGELCMYLVGRLFWRYVVSGFVGNMFCVYVCFFFFGGGGWIVGVLIRF